jgi:RNA polymerase sigma factor (TIGR02999 family)
MPTPRELLPEVYDELRRLAAAKLAQERPGQTLQATALVHEAWLRLAEASVEWRDRNHFLRVAATAMRRILVDRARARQSAKRGGGAVQVNGVEIAAPVPEPELLALSDALDRLAAIKPDHARLIELRYFAVSVRWRDDGQWPVSSRGTLSPGVCSAAWPTSRES